MGLTAQEEKRLAELEKLAAQADSSTPGQFRRAMAANPEIAETPYGKGPQQGLEHPLVDPIDFLPVTGGAKLVGRGLKGAAEATGISQIPGRLLSRAVSMPYKPGVSETLVKEGLMGTQGAMKNQIASKLAQRGDELTSAVNEIPNQVSSEPVAEGLRGLLGKYATPQGIIPLSARPEYTAVASTAQDVAARGAVDPAEALAFKRIAENGAYSAADKPLSSVAAKLGQTEGRGYGQALENAYGSAFPGKENAVAQANTRLTALLGAKKGIQKAAPSEGLSGLLTDVGVAGAGMATGHPSLGIGAVVGRHALKSPLIQSTSAQGLQKAGEALSSPLVSGAASAIGTQKLSNAINDNTVASPQQSGWTQDDEQRLQRLEQQIQSLK